MTSAVVFDLWNTLIRNTCGRSLPSMLKMALDLAAMDQKQFRTHYDEAFCIKKRETAEHALTELCELCQIEPEEERFQNALKIIHDLRHCVEPFPETLDVLARLRKKYKVVILTNTSYPAFRFAMEKAPMEPHVDIVFKSYEAHLIKPDPRFFSMAAKELRLPPEEILMVGDNLFADIYGAQAVGFRTLLLDRYGEYDFSPKIKSLNEIFEHL